MSTNITPQELHTLLLSRPDAAVWDVRTPKEFSAVHVGAARNIPLDELSKTAAADAQADRQRPVYLLCHSGRRAVTAAAQLAQLGFTDLVIVSGGTVAWADAGLPVVRGRGVISLERQVRIAAGALTLSGVLLGWFVHPLWLGLSGFIGAGLIFAGVTDWCGMALLLAKLPWNKSS